VKNVRNTEMPTVGLLVGYPVLTNRWLS